MSTFTWRRGGSLPHLDARHHAVFVTFRLADSVPRHLRLEVSAPRPGQVASREHVVALERMLDKSIGSCLLRDPRIAGIVADELRRGDGTRYRLHAWVVMPNHVHALFTPLGDVPLHDILRVWKGRSAHRINSLRDRSGPVWQAEYFDRTIRDADHFERAWVYIEANPAKAGLCERHEDWPFGSARERINQGAG